MPALFFCYFFRDGLLKLVLVGIFVPLKQLKQLKQIFHHYKFWEDAQAGLWGGANSEIEEFLILKSEQLLKSRTGLLDAMTKVLNDWPMAAEQNLTNQSINQKAWLGQSACCYQFRAPEHLTRAAWGRLSEKERKQANSIAAFLIKKWKSNHSEKMQKKKLGISVLEAAQSRIQKTFDEFERVYISFSGGKDSTVMLHLVMQEAIKRGRKVGILFVDLEGQYKLTVDHVKTCYEMYAKWSEPFWCCLPIHLRNAVSVYETHWICWEKEKENSWGSSIA